MVLAVIILMVGYLEMKEFREYVPYGIFCIVSSCVMFIVIDVTEPDVVEVHIEGKKVEYNIEYYLGVDYIEVDLEDYE